VDHSATLIALANVVCTCVQGPPETPVVYEVRVYSLLRDSLGQVLAAKAIRAAHCLTSIQFSPCSEHILLAYGRCSSLCHFVRILMAHVASLGRRCFHTWSALFFDFTALTG
jgi:hypothetical protein